MTLPQCAVVPMAGSLAKCLLNCLFLNSWRHHNINEPSYCGARGVPHADIQGVDTSDRCPYFNIHSDDPAFDKGLMTGHFLAPEFAKEHRTKAKVLDKL